MIITSSSLPVLLVLVRHGPSHDVLKNLGRGIEEVERAGRSCSGSCNCMTYRSANFYPQTTVMVRVIVPP